MAAAVDTNVLVRLVTQDDEEQFASAVRFVSAGVWISHLVLVETMWVLRSDYGFSHERIIATIEDLLGRTDATIQDAETVASALTQYQNRPNLGFSDCLIVEIARKAGQLPLGTFDRNLARLDGTQQL